MITMAHEPKKHGVLVSINSRAIRTTARREITAGVLLEVCTVRLAVYNFSEGMPTSGRNVAAQIGAGYANEGVMYFFVMAPQEFKSAAERDGCVV
jgi:hypothetical protein